MRYSEDYKRERDTVSKYKRNHQLSIAEKTTIVYDVVVNQWSHKDVANKHKVKPSLVQYLVSKVKRNPQYLKELMSHQEKKQIMEINIAEATQHHLHNNIQITSVASLKKYLKDTQ